MKTRIALVALALACAFASTAQAAPYFNGNASNINQRQYEQQRRIQQGVRSGELTRREAGYLQHREAQVRRVERAARADGYVSPRERAQINRMLDANSREIRRQKHDGQFR